MKPFRGKPEKPERSKGEIQRVPDNRGESVTSDRRRSRAGGSVSVPPAAERVHFSPCRTSRPVGFRSKACGSVRWSFRSNGAANARPETFYRRYNRGEGPRLTFASGRSQVRTVNPKCGPGAASGTVRLLAARVLGQTPKILHACRRRYRFGYFQDPS